MIVAAAVGLELPGRSRALALGTALLGATAILLFPYARAATAALLVALVATLAVSLRRKAVALAVGAALLAVVAAAVGLDAPLRERFLSGLTASGGGDRDQLLSTGLRAVGEHPLVGVGLGRFRPAGFADASTPEHVRENAGKAHNQFLSLAAETGVPGALLFCVLLVWLARRMDGRTARGAAGLGALVFFVALGMLHDPLIQAPFSMALVLVLGSAVRGQG